MDACFWRGRRPMSAPLLFEWIVERAQSGNIDVSRHHALVTMGGHAESVQVLLDSGTDVNAKNNDGTTALMFAEEEGHTEIVELLKKAGARE